MKLALALAAFSIVASTTSAFAADFCGLRKRHAFGGLADIEYQYRHVGDTITLQFTQFSGPLARGGMEDALKEATAGGPDAAKFTSYLPKVNIHDKTLIKVEIDRTSKTTTFTVDGTKSPDAYTDDLFARIANYIEKTVFPKGEDGTAATPCN